MSVDPMGFRRLADGYLASRANPNTRDGYARDLAVLQEGLGIPGDVEGGMVFDVERDHAARAAAEQLSALPIGWWQDWRDGLAGSVASRRRKVAAVRSFCRWWSTRMELANPVRELSPPSTGRAAGEADVVALAPAEVRAMCEAATRPGALGARTHALIETLYGCGLRASEASGLDLSACRLEDSDDPYILVDGKGGLRRAVAVPRTAREALTAYIAVARPQLRAKARSPRAGDADAVFLSARGRRLSRTGIWRIVVDVAERAGVRDAGTRVFPHALRHSCGTHLVQSGVDIRYVQSHLGHASPVTTEIYTHVTAAHLRDDFDRAHPRARRR